MKRINPARNSVILAFTLTELLVVIAIIAILASLILPALSRAKISAQKKIALTEESSLVAAISQYNAQYSRLPASTNAVNAASQNTNGDFTFGTVRNNPASIYAIAPTYNNIPQQVQTAGETTYQNDNSEVISILRDDNFFPESFGGTQHIYNPTKTGFFTAKASADPPQTTLPPPANTPPPSNPGIGWDDTFRDPWGTPYIVTLDLNYDSRCFDSTLAIMYSNQVPNTQLFVPGEAIVWSLGPLKTFNLSEGLHPTASNSTNKQTLVLSF